MNILDDRAGAGNIDSGIATEIPDGHGLCELTGLLCEIRQLSRIQLPWPLELYYRRGSQHYLRGVEIYHDFSWLTLFKHNNCTFPKGSYLANHARDKCPSDFEPAILLTTRTEIQEVNYLQRAGRYIVVVNISDYLAHSRSNPAASFVVSPLAGRLGWLASIEETDLEALKATDPDSFAKLVRLGRRCIGQDSTTLGDVQAAIESLPELDQVSIDAIIAALLKRGTDTEVLLQRLVASGHLDDVSDILEWLLDGRNVDSVKQLSRLQGDSISKLNAVSNVVALTRLLEFWDANQGNGRERFWQEALERNLAILSQLFSFPIVVMEGQAYVGGKRVDNRGGSITDFLCKNAQTNNVAFIEIKTPCTDLLSGSYRNGTWNICSEISGAVVQVANQRDKLVKDCYRAAVLSGAEMHAFSPRCVIVAGNTKQLANDVDKIQSFELYRNALAGIEIITFDELFGRAQLFIDALGATSTNVNVADDAGRSA